MGIVSAQWVALWGKKWFLDLSSTSGLHPTAVATQAWQKWNKVPGAAACSGKQILARWWKVMELKSPLRFPWKSVGGHCLDVWGRLSGVSNLLWPWQRIPHLCQMLSWIASRKQTWLLPSGVTHTGVGTNNKVRTNLVLHAGAYIIHWKIWSREEEGILDCSVIEIQSIFPCLPPLVGRSNTTTVLLWHHRLFISYPQRDYPII